MEPLQGSCLCGGVRFEITEPFLNANHCHCTRCRKHSGTFGETQGRVPREGFRLLQGEELIRVFRPAEGAGVKAFCSRCGSSLFGRTWPDGPEISIRLGALDGDPDPAGIPYLCRLEGAVGDAAGRRPAALPGSARLATDDSGAALANERGEQTRDSTSGTARGCERSLLPRIVQAKRWSRALPGEGRRRPEPSARPLLRPCAPPG